MRVWRCSPARWRWLQATSRPIELNREFQKAVAQYDAGHFAEAAAQLESLLPNAPESFEVHELLGLVYTGESQDGLANPHLEKAVRLNPASAAARTNLATNLIHLGKLQEAQEHLQKSGRARAAEL